MNIDFDYTQRHYTITYYRFMDMFADIGGLAATFAIFVAFLTFFIPLGFLSALGHITKKNSTKKAMDEFEMMIKVAKRQFLAIQ